MTHLGLNYLNQPKRNNINTWVYLHPRLLKDFSMKNRKKFEEELISLIEKITGNKRATGLYKAMFKKMSDKAFLEWLDKLGTEEETLTAIVPNGERPGLDIKNLQDIAANIGCKLYERVWLLTPSGLPMLSTHKALLTNILVRRLSQSQTSKLIVPHDDKSIDSQTGQPTKASTGNSLTNPEVELLASYGLSKTAGEIHNIRGGDEGAYRAYKALISSTGRATKNDIAPFKTGIKSSKMVTTLFVSAMIHPT